VRRAANAWKIEALGHARAVGEGRLIEFTQCRIGFCERNVKPRMSLASSTETSTTRMSDSASRSIFRRRSISCSLTSTSVRRFLIDASSRSSRAPRPPRSARISSVSKSMMSRRGSGAGQRGILERAHDVQERVAVANSLGVQAAPLALGDPREVHHLERRNVVSWA